MNDPLKYIYNPPDPEDYPLVDTDGEKRWGFRLADALTRAALAERRIFHGYTFYVTKNVTPIFEVVLRVAESAGGKVCSTAYTSVCIS